MIANLANDSEAGIYSLAYSISQIMTLVNTALMGTISPWIYQKIKNKTTEDIAGISYITMIIVASVNLLLIALAPEAVSIFAPKEYYDAIWIIPPVAMSVFFMYCYDLFAKFQFYFEKSHYIAIASICGAVLNIILNYIFIPIFGYYAAGYTTLMCYIVYDIVHFIFMKKVCKENLGNIKIFDIKILLSIAGIFVFFGFVVMALYNMLLIRMITLVLFCMIVFLKRNIICRVYI